VLSLAARTAGASGGDDGTSAGRARSVIFFVSDGMGPGYVTMTREAGLCASSTLGSLTPHLVGLCETRSANSMVTDSAAGATAYATGFRTDNHVIGEVPIRDFGVGAPASYRPAGTVLEGAQLAGKRTGIVTTTRVTHATPAAFSSHLADRDDENEIAREQVYSLELNVLFGGGRRHFDPSSVAGSARADALDLVADARREGYALVTNATSMRRAAREAAAEAAHSPGGGGGGYASPRAAASARPRLLGLFAPSHMPYEIDRAEGDVETPTLAEMTGAALEALAPSEAGFFLLVEAGRIDHAGHANDAATAAREVCAYDAAWAVALEFADRHPDVLVVGSSDHDTGGLSVGCCDRYAMDGDALRRQKFSAEYVAYAIIDAYGAARTNGEDVDAQGPAILAAAFAAAGRDVDAAESRITAEALAALHEMAKAASDPANGAGGTHGYEGWALQNAVGEALSAASSVGWTSHGHTGVDVAVFARGPGAEAFRGYSRNDEVGRAVIDALGVDPAAGLEAFEQRMALKNRASPPPSQTPG